jgi:hypothetical protein
LLVFAAYFLVTFDQGHGWGYRYFHPAWGALPLLGAGALVHPAVQPAVRRFLAASAAASLLACTALRFAQVRTFIDAQLAQIPATDSSGSKLEVVMVRIGRGYYTIDLVQNDPFLDGGRWMLFSSGETDEERFMAQAFPGARMVRSNATASVWQVR